MAAPCVRRGPVGAGVWAAAGGVAAYAGAGSGAGAAQRRRRRRARRRAAAGRDRLLHQLLHLGRAARKQHRLREPDAGAAGGRRRAQRDHAAHLGQELPHRQRPPVRALVHRLEDDAVDLGRERGVAVDTTAGGNQLPLRHLVQDGAGICPRHGRPARQQQHQDAAQAVRVRALVDQLPLRLLRRQVLGHAEHRLRYGDGRHEVDHLDLVVAGDEHVLGRQIVVNDADLLAFQQRLADLRDDRLRAIERQRARVRDQLVQRLTVAELAGDEQAPVGVLAEVEHAREPGALGALQLLQLALRPFQRRRRRQRRLRDQLVRDGLARLAVARAEDLAAARSAELRFRLVALRRRRWRCAAGARDAAGPDPLRTPPVGRS